MNADDMTLGEIIKHLEEWQSKRVKSLNTAPRDLTNIIVLAEAVRDLEYDTDYLFRALLNSLRKLDEGSDLVVNSPDTKKKPRKSAKSNIKGD